MAKKRKQSISAAERARRRRQARINFGLTKKRRSTKLRRTSNVARKKRRTTRRLQSLKPIAVLVAGGTYGALREKVSMLISPVTSKIPIAGNLSDEIGMFALSYVLNKNVRNKLIKDVSAAGMLIEAARMGDAVVSGQVNGLFNGVGSGSAPVYGPTLG